ncbi:MAG: ribosome maturation factor RimM [Bacilli bacterium]
MNIKYVGKIVNTHALKGELRIISQIDNKDLVFKVSNCLFIGKEKRKEVINSYRKHKNYDMVTFKGYNDILEVKSFIGENVYFDRDLIDSSILFEDDIIGFNCIYNNEEIGKLTNITNNNGYKLLVIDDHIYVPYNKEFIEKIDACEIILKNLEGLI